MGTEWLSYLAWACHGFMDPPRDTDVVIDDVSKHPWPNQKRLHSTLKHLRTNDEGGSECDGDALLIPTCYATHFLPELIVHIRQART